MSVRSMVRRIMAEMLENIAEVSVNSAEISTSRHHLPIAHCMA